MKLRVNLCKHCILDRKECDHYRSVREKTATIKAPGCLSHNCPIYYTLIPIGEWGSVELKSYDPEEDVETLDYGEGMYQSYQTGHLSHRWVSLGWASGTVAGKSNLKGFYLVKLDVPVELGRPDKSGTTQEAIQVKMETVAKRANAIKREVSP